MRSWKLFVCVGVLAASMFLMSCGRGRTSVKTNTTATTVGQELMDLDAAYKNGIITEKEYNEQKAKIMKRR